MLRTAGSMSNSGVWRAGAIDLTGCLSPASASETQKWTHSGRLLSAFLSVIGRKADSNLAAEHPLLPSARKASESRMTLGEPTSLSTLFSVSGRIGEGRRAVPLRTHCHGDSVPVAGTMTCLWGHATPLAQGAPFRVYRTKGALGTERASPWTLDVSQLATNDVTGRPT